jgi:hypothetical protein
MNPIGENLCSQKYYEGSKLRDILFIMLNMTETLWTLLLPYSLSTPKIKEILQEVKKKSANF